MSSVQMSNGKKNAMLPIVESIIKDIDCDLVLLFSGLPPSQKIQCLEQLVDACSGKVSFLRQHRFLLCLARLLEDLANSGSKSDLVGAGKFIQRHSSLVKSRSSFVTSPRNCTSKMVEAFCTNIKLKARNSLQVAIAERVPQIDAPTNGKWPSRHQSFHAVLPARLDVGMGGISDMPPYCMEHYGNCIGIPILIGNKFPVEARAEILRKRVMHVESLDKACAESGVNVPEIRKASQFLRIHWGVIEFVNTHLLHHKQIDELYSKLNGGLKITTFSHLPVGTGLGISSLLPCVLLKAISHLVGLRLSDKSFFAASVYLENLTGIGGGWEDSTAIQPGIKLMLSSPTAPFSPEKQSLSVRPETIELLQRRLLLVYTGINKTSMPFFDELVERYCLRERNIVQAAERNFVLNNEMKAHLEKGDMAAIGACMQTQWENWKLLTNNRSTNRTIEDLFRAAAPHVHGARINGGGGGGCAMFLVREGESAKLKRTIKLALGDQATFYQWQPVVKPLRN